MTTEQTSVDEEHEMQLTVSEKAGWKTLSLFFCTYYFE